MKISQKVHQLKPYLQGLHYISVDPAHVNMGSVIEGGVEVKRAASLDILRISNQAGTLFEILGEVKS